MLVLLPLRGWLGDAMAMQQMGQAGPPSVAAAPHAMAAMTDSAAPAHDGQQRAMHADCPGHAGVPDTPADGTQHGSADCATCAACQLCHTVGLMLLPPQFAAVPSAAGRPQGHAPHFSSAERAPGDKPPIA